MDFAGSWYPRGREACLSKIESYLTEGDESAAATRSGVAPARIGIVPHAGWVYSGRLAGRTFNCLTNDPGVELVVLLGGHLGRGDPIVAMVEGEWETPFGPFVIHEGFTAELEQVGSVVLEREGRYTPDNSTELQLPFAKHRFPAARLLPLRVPPGNVAIDLGRSLAGYLERSGLNAVVIASTDLTHYGPNYGFTPKGRGPSALAWVRAENDAAFIRAVESGQSPAILAAMHRQRAACSAGSVVAANEIALSRGQRFRTLAYTISADVSAELGAGESAENFVGYLSGVYC